MKFVQIDACLIAEVIRKEEHGKLGILGVFGLTPNVRIYVQKMPANIVLSFVVFGDFASGKFPDKFSIVSKSSNTTIISVDMQAEASNERKFATKLLLSFPKLDFPADDDYLVRLNVTEHVVFEGQFRVETNPKMFT